MPAALSVIAIMGFAGAKAEAASYVNIYLNNAEILTNNNFVDTAIRAIGWLITKGLVVIGRACEGLYDKAFGFIDFTTNEKVNNFVETFKPLLLALMAAAFLALGITLIMRHEKKPNIVINICIFVLCVSCSTLIFSEMNSLAKSFKTGILDNEEDGVSEVYKVIDNNLVDLVDVGSLDGNKLGSLSQMNFENRKAQGVNYFNSGIDENIFSKIEFNEVLNYKTDKFRWDNESEEILKNRLVVVNAKNGTYSTDEVSNGIGWNSEDDDDFGNGFYYRYTFFFLASWLQIVSLIIIYLTMSYKCLRIAFELVIARLLAYLYSTEISGGEKIKKILLFIRDSYILLCITTLCIKVYSLMTGLISQNEDGLVKGAFSLFIAFAVIDGPNLVERLLGMDAGLKSSTARLMAFYGMAKGSARTAASGARRTSEAVFGTKTKPPMPHDGKRHGGIADKLNGTKAKGKEAGKRQWENATASNDSGYNKTTASDNVSGETFTEDNNTYNASFMENASSSGKQERTRSFMESGNKSGAANSTERQSETSKGTKQGSEIKRNFGSLQKEKRGETAAKTREESFMEKRETKKSPKVLENRAYKSNSRFLNNVNKEVRKNGQNDDRKHRK